MTSIKLSFIILISAFLSAGIVSAQTAPQSGSKKELIQQFRTATGADNVNLNIEISLDETKKALTDMIEKEAGLSDEQRKGLRVSADEAYSRLESALNAFIQNREHITHVAEQIIFATYDQAFTEDEIRELVAHYRTPLGKKGLAFLRSINKDFENAFNERMVTEISGIIKPKITEESELLKKKIADAKSAR